jgi:DNA-binding PadR family transcriptional regulator
MPACCDMRGMLQFLILWLLMKKPMYGEEIAIEIEKMRGEKPTPGTIYPALKQLVKKGSAKSEKKGRRVVYSLTKEGRQGIEEAVEYFCTVFGEIFLEYQLPSKRSR